MKSIFRIKWEVLLFVIVLLFVFCKPSFATPLSDDTFLNLLEKKSFDYFWNETSSATGLTRDRAANWGGDESRVASIAGVGFALTSYPIAIERGWISRDEGYKRTLRTLRVFSHILENKNGFYFHFLDRTMGTRAMESEVSSIDTALFLMGALTAGQYFKGTDVEVLANELYKKADFKWMLNQGNMLSMGWRPETGFLTMRWAAYDESTLLYLLAIGSGTHAIPATSWNQIKRKVGRYGAYTLVESPPLFTHQYLHLWLNLKDKHDAFMDYFRNSTDATLANRQFCIDQSLRFPSYSQFVWGLSACEGPRGYRPYGAPPGIALHDGTISPYAIAGSIVFTPKESIASLRYLYDQYKIYLWGRYGFSDAVCTKPFWRTKYCYAIDMGAMLIAIENYRTGFIWKLMQDQPDLARALTAVGFQAGTKEVRLLQAPVFHVPQTSTDITTQTPYRFSDKDLEFGDISNDSDFSASFTPSWDSEFLNLHVIVKDQDLTMHRGARALFKDDCVEVFVDPNQDGFAWKESDDFQFIFSPRPENQMRAWESNHEVDPIEQKWAQVNAQNQKGSYEMNIKITWKSLGIQPKAGDKLRISLAVHDADRFESEEDGISHPSEIEKKVNTFFQGNGKEGKNELAVFILD